MAEDGPLDEGDRYDMCRGREERHKTMFLLHLVVAETTVAVGLQPGREEERQIRCTRPERTKRNVSRL